MKCRYLYILLGLLSVIVGCSDDLELPAPTREAVHETTDYWPVVAINDRAQKAGPCTGTLISPVAVITTAHCFPRGKRNIHIENDFFAAEADVVDMLIAPSPESNPNDIAILKISRVLRGTPVFYPIGNHIAVRNLIRLVGYGHLSELRDFKKRTGTNIIFEKTDFLEIKYAEPATGLRGAFNRAGGTEGDSGGPYLLYENGEHYIVGLIQSRDIQNNKTYGVDLTRPEHRAFIQKVNDDFSLGIPAF